MVCGYVRVWGLGFCRWAGGVGDGVGVGEGGGGNEQQRISSKFASAA